MRGKAGLIHKLLIGSTAGSDGMINFRKISRTHRAIDERDSRFSAILTVPSLRIAWYEYSGEGGGEYWDKQGIEELL